MATAEKAEWENIRRIVEEGKPLNEDELSEVSGGLYFRETTYDRWRLWTCVFFNGELDGMSDIVTGKPLSQISWRL